MDSIIRRNVLRIKPESSFIELINMMLSAKKEKAEIGLVVVEDNAGYLMGVITDGDVRRALGRKIDYNAPIDSLIVDDPVTIPYSASRRECIRKIKEHEKRLKIQGRWYRPEQILVVRDNQVIGVVDKKTFFSLLSEEITAVNIGLGYIGLPFSAIVANAGIRTCGVDIDAEIVELARQGKARFFEPGLEDLLQTQIALKTIQFSTSIPAEGTIVYFVSVGTPLDSQENFYNDYIESAVRDIGKNLVGGELVVIRSTVVVGVTRNTLIPIIEFESNLEAGNDFNVVFAPERVVEGKVIEEYSSIPQVIGGYTETCLKRGMAMFSRFNSHLIEAESLEMAELIKLVNNTFRDVSFAFANEIALICDHYNIDATKLVRSANEGYPRNQIAVPSPGVGGMCLPKDSKIYSSSPCSLLNMPKFGEIARNVNDQMPNYVHLKIKQWKERMNLTWQGIRVAIFGAAFKGMPETSDLRNSPSIDLMRLLKKDGVQLISVRDIVVSENDLLDAGFDYVWNNELDLKSKDISCILIINNHITHKNLGWNKIISDLTPPVLVFDAWSQLNEKSVLSHPGVSYGRMGGIVYG